MSVEIFLILLTFFSVITSLTTEATKKLLDSLEVAYASNIVVLCAAAIVGGAGTAFFYIWNGCPWSTINIVCIFLMVFSNWLGAMVGYDKVKQAITQFKSE